jgi:hypothetical protein
MTSMKSRSLMAFTVLVACASACGGSVGSVADAGSGGGSGGGSAGGAAGGSAGGSGGGSAGGSGGGSAGGSGGGSAGGSGGGSAGGSGGGSAGGSGGGSAGGSGGGTAGGGSAGGSGGGSAGGSGGGSAGGSGSAAVPYIFVIAMENQDGSNFVATGIYGNSNAPYINNTLRTHGGSASAYSDNLAALVPSEPHYVWMEAGTNVFGDGSFTSDKDPSAANSTSDATHIAAQLAAAGKGNAWRSYQEDLNSSTGACPVKSSGFYAAKHDPFVFFQDVSGSPPSANNTSCAAHHRAYTAASFQSDLAAGDVAAYTFITPNLCNDMHGASGCANGCTSGFSPTSCIAGGDAWLQSNVPAILSFIDAHGGVLFVLWDEPALSSSTPFVVLGPHVKVGYSSAVAYTHSSYVKSLGEILGLPANSRVAAANDFADFFEAGYFP